MGRCLLVAAAVLASCRGAALNADEDVARGPDCIGWEPDSAYGRQLDPATIETVRGEMVVVELLNPRKGMACGVGLQLPTDEGSLPVHLGPRPYVVDHISWLAERDVFLVTGSRVLFKGEPTLNATQPEAPGEILVLRDDSGMPAWGEGVPEVSGRRRRGERAER